MKRLLFLLVASFALSGMFAQTAKNTAQVVLTQGTYLVVGGDYTNATEPSGKGSLTVSTTISGAMSVAGTTINNVGNAGIVVKNGGNLLQNSDNVNATVEQEILENQWHLISNPTAPFDLSATFSGNFYQYEELNDAWPNASGDLMQNNRGYLIRNANNAATLSIEGILNNGNMAYPLTFDGKGNSFNLVGNPYPCTIDWTSVSAQNTSGVLYVWDATADQYGTNNGEVGTFATTSTIQANQGFFVKASSEADFTIANNNKVLNLETVFYKKNAISDLLRISLTGEESIDETVIYFKEGATEKYDLGIDADKLLGTATNLYSLTGEGKPMAINATSTKVKTIPLNFSSNTDGNYTLAVSEYTFSTDIIYIEDKLTSSLEMLSENMEYTFSHKSTNIENRFVLHFNSTPTAIDNTIENQEITIFAAQGKLNVLNAREGTIQVFDLLGKLVYSSKATSNIEQIELSKSALYIVKAVKDNKITTRKVMISD